MRSFVVLMNPKAETSVLDLGGQPMIWDSVPMRLDLVILNKPGVAASNHPSHHRIRYEDGDACAVKGFDQRSFDCVFSNSVIEHVGPVNKQVEFAGEVRRFGKSYWVQTPSRWFPIEAHCGMPFWWFYPRWLRQYFIERWRIKLPAWTQMVEETTVLAKSDLRRLFPEATILIETSFGLPKSYIAYFVGT
jgi:SAM-dependent methyltransferase